MTLEGEQAEDAMDLLKYRLRRSCENHADYTALVAGDVRWTYQELSDHAHAIAAELLRRGLGREDRIAIDFGNDAMAVAAIHGALLAGCAFNCMDAASPDEHFQQVLSDLDPALLLTGSLRTEDLRVEALVLESIEQLPAPSEAEFGELAALDIDPEGTFNLVYTSGSTGDQKGVVATQRSVLVAADAIAGYLGMNSSDRVLCLLPLSFGYGLYQLLTTHLTGGCLVLEKGLGYPGPLLKLLREEKVSIVPGVPTVFALLLKTNGFNGKDLPALRCLTNAGAGLAVERTLSIRNRFPDAELFLMYGLTECKRVSFLPPHLVDEHPGSVGMPMEGCEVAIVSKDGEVLDDGEIGELVVRGEILMKEYWRRPEQTAKCIKQGPFGSEPCLWTGDLFRREAGLLYFVGRRDDVFKSRGEKVAPLEVEGVLIAHEKVIDAAILPVDDEVYGVRIVALMVCAVGTSISSIELHAHCSENLEPHKVPHEYRVVDELPQNSHGKIDRSRLRHAMDVYNFAPRSGGSS